MSWSGSSEAVLHAGTGLKGLSGIKNLDAGRGKRRRQELSEAELFELRQLVASGVKDIRDCPELLADEESDEEAAVALTKGGTVEQDFEVLLC
jgi:hypothetical protein